MKVPHSFKALALQIAIGYLTLFGVIAFIFIVVLEEYGNTKSWKKEAQRIEHFRSNIHIIHNKITELSLLGEGVLEWEDEDFMKYRAKRMDIDSLIGETAGQATITIPKAQIDTLCQLLANKEKQLFQIMQVLNEQEKTAEQLEKQLSSITQKVAYRERSEEKKKGVFFGIFKKKKKPTPATALLYSLDEEVIQKQKAHTEQLSLYAEQLNNENRLLGIQLNAIVGKLLDEVTGILDEKQKVLIEGQQKALEQIIYMVIIAAVLLCLLSLVIVWSLLKRKHVEVALAHTNDDKQKLLEGRKRIMLDIVHDIRGPLNIIYGSLEVIRSKKDYKVTERNLGYIENSCGNILMLVNNLQDYYRLKDGQEPVHNKSFDLEKLFGQMSDEYGILAEKKKLKFLCNQNNCAHIVMGDEDRIKRIVYNLLNNSLKFTTQGKIELDISYSEFEDMLLVKVKDTGCGIGEKDLEEIFRPFKRDQSDKNTDGLGLGLTNSKKIAQMLGGDIEVKSAPGRGTCFTVSLPLSVSEEILTDTGHPSPKETLATNIKVLAIDDDPLQLCLLKERLEYAGITCDTCSQMDEVYQNMRKNHYDILLTDIQMRTFDGFMLLEQLRETEIGNSQTIPVIAVTAREDRGEDSFDMRGFAGYIYKPYTMDDLLEQIASCVKKEEEKVDFNPLLENVSNPERVLRVFMEENEKQIRLLQEKEKEQDAGTMREILHLLKPVWAEFNEEHPLLTLRDLLIKEGINWEKVSIDVSTIVSRSNFLNRQAEIQIRSLQSYKV